MNLNVIRIDGTEYVILPRKEYERLRGEVPAGAVDALEYAQQAIAANLKAAREVAGLTQGDLAEKMGKSQTMVSLVESGRERAPKGYVEAVLKACKLPKTWKAPQRGAQSAKRQRRG